MQFIKQPGDLQCVLYVYLFTVTNSVAAARSGMLSFRLVAREMK